VLISMYPIPPMHYRRYFFNIGSVIADILKRNISKSIANTFLAGYFDTKFLILRGRHIQWS